VDIFKRFLRPVQNTPPPKQDLNAPTPAAIPPSEVELPIAAPLISPEPSEAGGMASLHLEDVETEALAETLAIRLEQMPGNPLHNVFYRHGFHLLRKHFYLPIPDDTDNLDVFWDRTSELVGVNMNDAVGLEILQAIMPKYLPEFRDRFPIQRPEGPFRFWLINGGYMAVDAHVYYSLIRHYKPKRIVEIGVGNSTLLAIAANERNRSEGASSFLTSIDPYPWDIFRSDYPGLDKIMIERVQDVPMATFEELDAGDILFIDSSHVLRSGNDVHFEFMEVLPRLRPGVMVHVHDISLPEAYPKVYYDSQLYWNEQYLLQAFLIYNSRFEVLWAGNYMMLKYPELMHSTVPEIAVMRETYPQSEPTAFWMRVKS
jgi:hypothetical protein